MCSGIILLKGVNEELSFIYRESISSSRRIGLINQSNICIFSVIITSLKNMHMQFPPSKKEKKESRKNWDQFTTKVRTKKLCTERDLYGIEKKGFAYIPAK